LVPFPVEGDGDVRAPGATGGDFAVVGESGDGPVVGGVVQVESVTGLDADLLGEGGGGVTSGRHRGIAHDLPFVPCTVMRK
jgi:hypothetical protein